MWQPQAVEYMYLWWSAIIEEPVKQNEEKFWIIMQAEGVYLCRMITSKQSTPVAAK